MFYKIAFLAVLISFPVITNASIPEDIQKRFLATVGRAKFNTSEPFRIQLITDDPLLIGLCQHNEPANYQNPSKCDQFIICDYQRAFLAECPEGTGAYNPIVDECGYSQPPPAESCPWKSIWSYPDGVTSCQTLGEGQFWGYLTFPVKTQDRCGNDIIHCKNYQVTYEGVCGPGFGYSKAFLGCLDLETCKDIDKRFGL